MDWWHWTLIWVALIWLQISKRNRDDHSESLKFEIEMHGEVYRYTARSLRELNGMLDLINGKFR
jgi:hypothetical protein